MNSLDVTCNRIEDTKERRLTISPDHENAVRDIVKHAMSRHGLQYSDRPWQGDAITGRDIARIYGHGEGREFKSRLEHDVNLIEQHEFRAGCYAVLRELLPLMLRMRECLDDFPEGTDIAPKFDALFYKSPWRG